MAALAAVPISFRAVTHLARTRVEGRDGVRPLIEAISLNHAIRLLRPL
jgi:hypothetical protein